jgi:hypothetical protein
MKIIIFHEKHGDRYFDASTQDKINAACHKIVLERLDDKRYSLKPSLWSVAEPELTRDQVENLPNGSVRREAERQWKEWENYEYNKRAEEQDISALKRIQAGDKELAYKFLHSRRHNEYERFTIKEVESL